VARGVIFSAILSSLSLEWAAFYGHEKTKVKDEGAPRDQLIPAVSIM